jgi:hypothetical protein
MKINPVIGISLLGLAFSAPSVIAAEAATEAPAKVDPADKSLDGYPAISTALYKDDLAAAQKAAAAMAKAHMDSPLAKHCQAIADSKTLEEARLHFKELSDAAIPMAKHMKTMHEMHCPMASGGKGANWLQTSDAEVQNPYMGAKMPHCGKAVK